MDDTRFKGFTQRVKDRGRKLCGLVEKEDPSMRQRRCPGDERARAAMARTEETIGEALARIDGLRTLFGRKADVLEMRYIDLAAWDEIAAELGVDKRKAHRWHDMVCDWVDSFGWARASRGYGTAQI